MKKQILAGAFLLMCGISSFGQSTATQFTVNDCAGTAHDLFAELNAGKVVVISFVMPCGACIGPSQTAYSAVGGYASSNPGRVVFYVSDQGSCSTLNNWKTTNGMSSVPAFANAAVNPADYGGAAMPRIVVLGGASHTVFSNQTSGFSTSSFQTAINSALATGIVETPSASLKMSLFPNPTSNAVVVSYTLAESSTVNIDVFNELGAVVKTQVLEKQAAGKQEVHIAFDNALANGTYFLKVSTSNGVQTLKFNVQN